MQKATKTKMLKHIERATFYLKRSQDRSQSRQFGALFATKGNKKYNVTLLLRDAYRTSFEDTLHTINLFVPSCDPAMLELDFRTLLPNPRALENLLVKLHQLTTLFEDVHSTMEELCCVDETDIWAYKEATIKHQNENLSYGFLKDLMLQVMGSDYFAGLQTLLVETTNYLKEHPIKYSEVSLSHAHKIKTDFEGLMKRVRLRQRRLKFEYDMEYANQNFNLVPWQGKEGLFSCMLWTNTRLATHTLERFLDGISHDLTTTNDIKYLPYISYG